MRKTTKRSFVRDIFLVPLRLTRNYGRERLMRLRYRKVAFVGRGCVIEHPVTFICPENVRLGPYSVVKQFTWVYAPPTKRGATIALGSHSEINPFCSLLGGDDIIIGDYVLISPQVTIVSASNYYEPGWLIAENPLKMGPVRIGNNVHIGTGAVILPGITIGEGAVIGANAVVSRDVPAGAIAVGLPARVVKYRTQKQKENRSDAQLS